MPSQFTADCLKPGLNLPVFVRPHAVETSSCAAEERAKFGIPENAYVGMAIMDLRSSVERKNPWAHIEAWQRAFGKHPNFVLVFKALYSSRTNSVKNELTAMAQETNNIIFIDSEFSDEEMSRFQKMADVYLSLHRAEGFGLNLREMMDAATPVVATHWSAPVEFLSAYDQYYPVQFELIRIKDFWEAYSSSADAFWADADIMSASSQLRNAAASWMSSRT